MIKHTMIMRIFYLLFSLLFLLQACNSNTLSVDFTKWVDPLIGSGGHGHVFVGAALPHGMVQLGPNNLTKGWDWCSGYHDSDSTIVGFSHAHLSGTGVTDMGDILFMPVTGDTPMQQGVACDMNMGWVSTFDKRKQIVRPGYYSVWLDRYQIMAELTATSRVGLHRYTYPKNADAAVIIDLVEGCKSLDSRKGVVDSYIEIVNDTVLRGWRVSDEWVPNHKIYFTTVLSHPFISYQLYKDKKQVLMHAAQGADVKVRLNFGRLLQPLVAKTAISYTSLSNAWLNLLIEMPKWAFDATVVAAKQQWNDRLSAIDFVAKDSATMKIFYTSLYHTLLAPQLFCDVNSQYLGADNKVHVAQGFTPYTVFSLWDTYRATHPLYTLIDAHNADYINSLLTIAHEQQRMPVWHLLGFDTDCMVGVHSIPVVVDAALKGIEGIDVQQVWQAVKQLDTMTQHGLDYVHMNGYIPADKESWSVAKALEYSVDNYAVAQLAEKIGDKDAAVRFAKKACNYRYYFDAKTGFMRGKMSDGSFRKEFNPYYSLHLQDDYVEGNAWQYTWLVPHDVKGLITLLGGDKAFIQKLDSLFVVSSSLNEGASMDITGMIGQYAHGNEPSHHILYLYGYVGEQWKTAEKVRQVFDQFYTTAPDGLIGNEDCGQMSSWYIFSSLGFYPVNPVNGAYVFGSPIADKATIRLNNGKTFTIIAENNSPNNKYIQSITINGTPYTKAYILHSDIMRGGLLRYTMGGTPNKIFGFSLQDRALDKILPKK